MEVILNIIKPDSIPSHLLCLLILLIISLKNTELTQNLKIGFIYLASYIMILFKWVEPILCLLYLAITSFLILEIFTNDTDKKKLFNFGQKLIDCCYKLIVEYYLIPYLFVIITLVFVNNIVTIQPPSLFLEDNTLTTNIITIAVIFITLLIILYLFHCITRMKFETNTVSEIISKLKIHEDHNISTDEMERKFNILTYMEDRTFFSRKVNHHTSLSSLNNHIIHEHINKNTFLHPIMTISKIFSRGYGTIEMQLIRNIGVSSGYESCKVRRKIFEIIYSNIIFNSIPNQITKFKTNPREYKLWILWSYINHVPIKIKQKFSPTAKKSTSLQIFGKTFEKLSLEEFFIWCLGLRFYNDIGDITIKSCSTTISLFKLKPIKIKKALEEAKTQKIIKYNKMN